MRKLRYQLRDACRPSGSPRLSGPLVVLGPQEGLYRSHRHVAVALGFDKLPNYLLVIVATDVWTIDNVLRALERLKRCIAVSAGVSHQVSFLFHLKQRFVKWYWVDRGNSPIDLKKPRAHKLFSYDLLEALHRAINLPIAGDLRRQFPFSFLSKRNDSLPACKADSSHHRCKTPDRLQPGGPLRGSERWPRKFRPNDVPTCGDTAEPKCYGTQDPDISVNSASTRFHSLIPVFPGSNSRRIHAWSVSAVTT